MSRLLSALVYSNLFVAGVLTLLTSSTYFIIGDLAWRWYIPVSVFLGTFVLYTFHRLYKIDFIPADHLGDRHQFVLSRSNWMKLTMAIAVFAALLILPNFDSDTVVWLVPAAIASIGYTIPFIPAEKKWWRLRDIPIGKPIIISAVVTYLTLSFPVFDQWGIQELKSPMHLLLFIERFLFLLAVTLPFELRDRTADADAGLQTIATALGFTTTKWVGVAMAAAWLIALVVVAIATKAWSSLMLGVVMFAWLWMGYYRLHPKRSELYYILTFEGAIASYAVGAMLLSSFQ